MPNTDHIPIETLAALAEGHCDPAREAEIRGHLSRCRRCFSAYAEAVRFRSILLDDPNAFAPAEEVIRLGQAVAAGEPGRRSQTVPEPRAVGGRRPVRLRPVILAAPVAAALLLAALVWLPDLVRTEPQMDPSVLARIQAAVTETSARGMFLPAGQVMTGGESPVYRSGTAAGRADLEEAVEALARLYQRGQPTRALSFWLVSGQVAAGQLGNARAYAVEARGRFPEDQRFATLEAIIAFRESDLTRAEELLREVLRRDSTDQCALFNLGFMLDEQGRQDEAAYFLRAAQRCGPGTPLGLRAAALLAAMPQN